MSSLLTLPTVVWSKILDFMDLHNLKKLRSVCQQTKNMVEQPKYLQKFKITLENVEGQEIVMSSIVPWNNFVLNLHEDKALPEFLTQYGKFMEHLDIQSGLISDIPIILAKLSPRIQTLIIKAFISPSPSTFQSPILAKNFIELKKLEIGGIETFPGAPKTLFEIILDNCTNSLKHLSIPGLYQMESDGSYSTTEFHYTSLLLQSVVNYLKRIEKSQVQTTLVIDFWGGVKLDPEILLSIVQISSRLGVKLLHVPIYGLPMDLRALTSAHRKMFDKCIVSVVEYYVDMDMESKHPKSRVKSDKNSYIPRNSQFHIRINMIGGFENYAGFKLRDGPIHTLAVFALRFPRLQHPYPHLFQTQRPTVQKLQICSFMEWVESRRMNFGEDISFSFPNLKYISFDHCSCMRIKDFHALIHGLSSLEKLRIVKSDLYDEGLLGDDLTHPLIFKLKNLKHLELLRCDYVTDVSFTNAFRFMNLETFKWTYEKSCRVTFLHGISSLNSIDGGLKDSVQCLEFKTPGDCDRDEVDEFVNKFKSLVHFHVEKVLLSESESENESSDEDDNESDWETYSENSDESDHAGNETRSSDEEDPPKNENEAESEDGDE